jgi:hypothetical protein
MDNSWWKWWRLIGGLRWFLPAVIKLLIRWSTASTHRVFLT